VSRQTSPSQIDYIPSKFSASIAGFTGSTFKIELHPPSSIHYTHTIRNELIEQATVELNAEHWDSIYTTLEAVGVFNWKERYVRKDTHDGTQWTLDVKFPSREKKIWGDNTYPEYGEFKAFLELMSNVAGGRKFE
jgi:hypothetical protein